MTFSKFLIHLVIQSILQSIFLVYYFQTQNRVRYLMAFTAIFTLLLFPVDMMLLSGSLIMKNFFNILVLIGASRLFFRHHPWKKILIGVLLYETCLIETDMLASLPVFLFPSLQEKLLDAVYYFADFILAVAVFSNLLLFSSTFSQVTKAVPVIVCLLLNLIVTCICIFASLELTYNENFIFDCFISIVILVGVNGITLYSLIKTIQKSTHQEAMDEIRKVYQMQVEDYLMNQKEEEQLRKLRHDLLNFIQSSCPNEEISLLTKEERNPN